MIFSTFSIVSFHQLEIMTNIAGETTIGTILREFQVKVSEVSNGKKLYFIFDHAPVALLVEHQAVTQEVACSNPSRINTQDLKITEEKGLPL